MANVVGVKTLQETRLWQRLESRATTEGEIAEQLLANLPQICDEASNRAKRFGAVHPQYTLHDEAHFLRVAEIMGYLIPETVELNAIELSLLILAAYFHDQGMIPDDGELGTIESTADYRLFKNNWIIEHPNCSDISQRAVDARLSDKERAKCRELEHGLYAALFSDFLRQNHGKRSEDYVLRQYVTDKRLEIRGTGVASHLARLCHSHTIPVQEFATRLRMNYDESIGTLTVNTVYLALALRLADLLDFDRERTPDELFRTIHFTSDISLAEWAKHRAVEGWIISPEAIRFTMSCTHPAYQRTVLRFMDYIDEELANIHSALRGFPRGASRYELRLPEKVDRSRIRAKDDAYIYHDMEFALSRDEIVKLLMTDNLYQSPSLCVRELLQNSLDALRYRRALLKRDANAEWPEGRVKLEHFIDGSGREVLRCMDNGVGMDEDIIKRFLVKAGRSYYRSPEFEVERVQLAAANADFDPCARFGIGFMSCFMLGDEIKVWTRRHNGTYKPPGKPLLVEIHGLSSLVVIRPGRDDQPVGTTVEITGRAKPSFVDEWADRVQLLHVIDGYALATEFPIEAVCTLPEIPGNLRVPVTMKKPRTFLESVNASLIHTYEEDLSKIDARIRGSIRTTVPIDEKKKLTISNSEVEWFRNPSGQVGMRWRGSTDQWHGGQNGATCVDGILVCGHPGRIYEDGRLGRIANWISTGRDEVVVDVRGAIKPSLDPSRQPRGFSQLDADGTWRFLQSKIDQGRGLLWEQILAGVGDTGQAEVFWQYLLFYGLNPSMLRAGAIWSKLLFPLRAANGAFEWRLLGEIKKVRFDEPWSLGVPVTEGGAICVTESMSRWVDASGHSTLGGLITNALISMGTLSSDGSKLSIDFLKPDDEMSVPQQRVWRGTYRDETSCIPYAGQIRGVLSAEGPVETLNFNHPLTKAILDWEFVTAMSETQKLLRAIALCLSSRHTLTILGDADHKLNQYDRWRKYIATGVLSVDWSQMPAEHCPPYKVLLSDMRIIEFGKEVCKGWLRA